MLEDAGGWDAWNVTEDADRGIRLARMKYKIGMIAPPTLEAPPEKLSVWIAQRSRWLKGFLQTWLVLMRSPGTTVRDMGVTGFLSVQLTLGAAILSGLFHGPWLLWLILCLAFPELEIAPVFLWVAGIAYAASIVMALCAPGGGDWQRIGLALTQPIYWPLQSLAMARALYGLICRPHFWAKTPHTCAASSIGRSVSVT